MTDRVINPLKGMTDKSWFFEQNVYDGEGITRALKSTDGSGNIPKIINDMANETTKPTLNLPEELKGKKFRIRKLTPRECFRLMGVDDVNIDKIQAAGISNSGQYKLAGNSIVVDVLFHLFRKMFIETGADGGTARQPLLFGMESGK